MSDTDKPSFFETLGEAVSEGMHRRVAEIDLMADAVEHVYRLPEYQAALLSPPEQIGRTDEVARTIVQTSVASPQSTPEDISESTSSQPVFDEVIHLRNYREDALRKLAQAQADDSNQPQIDIEKLAA